MWATSEILKKLPKVNNHPMGEFLVSLNNFEISRFTYQ
jgi:hypothetical protein